MTVNTPTRTQTSRHAAQRAAGVLALVTALGLSACSSMSPRGRSTAVGAAVGAVAGQVVTGSAAGAAAGAVVGGLIGDAEGKKKEGK